jgi:hypothetical protein
MAKTPVVSDECGIVTRVLSEYTVTAISRVPLARLK